MDASIIDNVNAVVGKDDRLFNLGDISMRGFNLAVYRARLICKNIFVVPGNHDKEKELVRYFTVLPQCYMYENQGFKMVLCHYAMRVWHHSNHGCGMLYGHSHDALPLLPGVPTFDVGIDAVAHHFEPHTYRPLSLIEIKEEMKRLCALAPPTEKKEQSGSQQV
jgi:calcineurin-like phosphoesterase family protein